MTRSSTKSLLRRGFRKGEAMEKPTVEELSVADAVRVWIAFDEAHFTHKGVWRDFDKEDVLRLGCAECLVNKVIKVYAEGQSVGAPIRGRAVTF